MQLNRTVIEIKNMLYNIVILGAAWRDARSPVRAEARAAAGSERACETRPAPPVERWSHPYVYRTHVYVTFDLARRKKTLVYLVNKK